MNPFKRKPVTIHTTVIQPKEPVTGPLADLCLDIREHPEEYKRSDHRIYSKHEARLWIDPDSWTSCFLDCGRRDHTEREQGLMVEAARAHDKHLSSVQTVDLSARLAKLKAERGKHEFDLTAANLRNAIQEATDLGVSYLAAGMLFKAEADLLPVFEGTHRIVSINPVITIETQTSSDPTPVMRYFTYTYGGYGRVGRTPCQWIDRSGTPHRTRAAMRAANKMLQPPVNP